MKDPNWFRAAFNLTFGDFFVASFGKKTSSTSTPALQAIFGNEEPKALDALLHSVSAH